MRIRVRMNELLRGNPRPVILQKNQKKTNESFITRPPPATSRQSRNRANRFRMRPHLPPFPQKLICGDDACQRTPKLRAGKTQIRQPKKNACSKIPLFIRIQAQNSLSKVCRKSANYTKKRAFSGKRCIKKQPPPKKTRKSPRSLYLSGLAGFQSLEWSGREDSNLRPLRPERSALARLRYAPTFKKKEDK